MSKTFRYLVEDYEPDILVSGRPLTMAGEPGPQAERVAAVAQKIADELDLPLEFEDERLSSQEAKRILREQGLNEKPDEGQDRHDRRQPVLADVARSQKRGGFACLALSIRASRIVHGSPRRALLRLGQRPRSRCSVRLSLLSVLLNSPPLVPRSPLAALVLSNRFLPSARRGRPRNHAPTHIMLMARTALLQPRVRAITRTPAVVPKRKAPRCL